MRGLLLALVIGVAVVGAGNAATGSVSPDGTWKFTFSRQNGYGRLDLTNRDTGQRYRMYRSNDACCDQITWVGSHTLVFVDDYRVIRLDPDTRKTRRLAGFSDFVVSPNGRWLAGWADSGGHSAETVHVVPVAGGKCLAVPRRRDQDDSAASFSADGKFVQVSRRTFDVKLGEPVGGARLVRFRLSALRAVTSC